MSYSPTSQLTYDVHSNQYLHIVTDFDKSNKNSPIGNSTSGLNQALYAKQKQVD